MKTEQPILITSIKATEDIPKHRVISVDGSLGTASGPYGVLGISNADTKNNEMIPVASLGIVLAETSTAIPKGNPVYPADDGFIFNQGDGARLGISLDEATEAGQLIRVLLSPGCTVSGGQQ